MNKLRLYFLALVAALLSVPVGVSADVGDTFTVTTDEGVVLTYTITNEDSKLVQLYSASFNDVEGSIGTFSIPTHAPRTVEVASPWGEGTTITTQYYTVTSIGSYAVRSSKFDTLIIPSTVSTIGAFAFSECSGLKKVYANGKGSSNEQVWAPSSTFSGDVEKFVDTAGSTFMRIYEQATAYVPFGMAYAYSRGNCWKYFKEIVEGVEEETFAEAPVFSVSGGEYDGPQSVTITNPNGQGRIYYYLTGENNESPYWSFFPEVISYDGSPIEIGSSGVLVAYVTDGENRSPVARASYTITGLTIRVAGMEVNAKNQDDVLGDKGSVRIDAKTDALVLENANINAADYKATTGIEAYGGDLTIQLIGQNSITGDSNGIEFGYGSGVGNGGTLTLEGQSADATLIISAPNGAAVFGYLANVNIQNCQLIVQDATTGIEYKAAGKTDGVLSIASSTVDITATLSAMTGVYELQLGDNLSITAPAGATFASQNDNPSAEGNILVDGVVQSKVTIGQPSSGKYVYDLMITEVPVTSDNCDNITGGGIESGHVSFDPTTNTLTLDNATIGWYGRAQGWIEHWDGGGDVDGYEFRPISDLTIRLIGTNEASSAEVGIWYDGVNVTFVSEDGTGTLQYARYNPEEMEYMSEDIYADNLTIDHCTVHATGVQASGKLSVINGATLTATTHIAYGSYEFGEGIGLIQPTDATMGEDQVIFNEETKGEQHIVIGPKTSDVVAYNLIVGGVQVTSENAANITGAGIKDGKASFDASTSTLTLEEVTFDMSNLWTAEEDATGQGISVCLADWLENAVPVNNLTINLVGENTSIDRGMFIWNMAGDDVVMTITSADGEGKLAAPDEYYVEQYNMANIFGVNDLTFSNCQYRGHVLRGEKVAVVDKATITFQVLAFGEITLGEGIGIIKPTGATIDDLRGGLDADEVIIGPVEETVIDPVDEETTISFDVDNFTEDDGTTPADLNNTVIDNVYYTIDNTTDDGTDVAGYYDSDEECIVINQTTTSEQMETVVENEPGTSEVTTNYTGIIIEVPAGTGSVIVNTKTEGDSKVAVQVGDDTPTTQQQTTKGDVEVMYNVTDDTYVYVYATNGPSLSPVVSYLDGVQKAPSAATNCVKIYSITVVPATITGIDDIHTSHLAPRTSDVVYTLDGRKIANQAPLTSEGAEGGYLPKGVYIMNGKKVVVK